jgi:hypothetical protein
VLPVAFISVQELLAGAGGFAAAIAIGAFIGQVPSVIRPSTDAERRRDIAVGGFIGLGILIGLILYSGKWR